MATDVRLATFNCENLFSRAKVLNLRSNEKTDEILKRIAVLQALLVRDAYSPADKKQILALDKELSFNIEITEYRGKLFVGRGEIRRVSAAGRHAWDGGIAFRRATFSEQQRQNTALVIKKVAADVQCLVEIEDRPAIDAFNSQVLSRAFPYNMLIDGFDPRGIDVGLLTKRPILNVKTHIFDKDALGRIFSRDCLEVEVQVRNGVSLHLLVNHFKSQGYGAAKDNDAKRQRQAKAVARIIQDRFDLSTNLVAVLGDFNDAPNRPPKALRPLLGLTGLSDVLELQFANSADRWTYHYKSNEQIDYILVSDALKAAFRTAGVERRGMQDLTKISTAGEVQFPSVSGPADAASDHAAVWADFTL